MTLQEWKKQVAQKYKYISFQSLIEDHFYNAAIEILDEAAELYAQSLVASRDKEIKELKEEITRIQSGNRILHKASHDLQDKIQHLEEVLKAADGTYNKAIQDAIDSLLSNSSSVDRMPLLTDFGKGMAKEILKLAIIDLEKLKAGSETKTKE
jgi:recombinational DNA repair ATPase RecF